MRALEAASDAARDGLRECAGALVCAGDDAASLFTDTGTDGVKDGIPPKTKGFANGLRSFFGSDAAFCGGTRRVDGAGSGDTRASWFADGSRE